MELKRWEILMNTLTGNGNRTRILQWSGYPSANPLTSSRLFSVSTPGEGLLAYASATGPPINAGPSFRATRLGMIWAHRETNWDSTNRKRYIIYSQVGWRTSSYLPRNDWAYSTFLIRDRTVELEWWGWDEQISWPMKLHNYIVTWSGSRNPVIVLSCGHNPIYTS